jgi:hypothetical protein
MDNPLVPPFGAGPPISSAPLPAAQNEWFCIVWHAGPLSDTFLRIPPTHSGSPFALPG